MLHIISVNGLCGEDSSFITRVERVFSLVDMLYIFLLSVTKRKAGQHNFRHLKIYTTINVATVPACHKLSPYILLPILI